MATEVVELEVRPDGSYVALGSRDWHEALRGATIKDVWSVTDDEAVWDIYTLVHPDGGERVYALPVASP